ncbi:MAG: VOC family protein [Clostridia bacterium]|nr:VOC family protein [Clostridia bacterium]
MAKITGIGGVFIKTDQDHSKLRSFYKEKLGLLLSDYGVSIISDTSQILLTMKKGNDPYPFFNFTVDNIEEMMRDLKAAGVEVVKEIETYDYGKFAQVRDNCGNVVELWEPFREQYLAMVEKEIEEASKKGK